MEDHKRRPGRPPLGTATRIKLQMTIPQACKDWLQTEAERRQTSMSQVATELIEARMTWLMLR